MTIFLELNKARVESGKIICQQMSGNLSEFSKSQGKLNYSQEIFRLFYLRSSYTVIKHSKMCSYTITICVWCFIVSILQKIFKRRGTNFFTHKLLYEYLNSTNQFIYILKEIDTTIVFCILFSNDFFIVILSFDSKN